MWTSITRLVGGFTIGKWAAITSGFVAFILLLIGRRKSINDAKDLGASKEKEKAVAKNRDTRSRVKRAARSGVRPQSKSKNRKSNG